MSLQDQLEQLFKTGSMREDERPLSAKGVPIDTLIDIVDKGGMVKTGIDIISRKGVLLIEKNALIQTTKPLITIRQNGIFEIPINVKDRGGLWNKSGQQIAVSSEDTEPPQAIEFPPVSQGQTLKPSSPSVEARIKEITAVKAEASEKYLIAKNNIRKTLEHIRKSGGLFDLTVVEHTVADLHNFLLEKEGAFSFLAKELFLYDNYLLNHSINVCTTGTAILRKFNALFSESINAHLNAFTPGHQNDEPNPPNSFTYYFPEEIRDMAIGFFLHDIGKTAVPDSILNKPGPLSEKEFALAKTHSFEKGVAILEKNGITNPYLSNIIQYHHSPLYPGETIGYPGNRAPAEIPAYVKICKIADCYDAMTSKRSYDDAHNPISVVTRLFRSYARKDPMLQFILHSFVTAVGIHPPGSVVYLTNQQMAYVMDSKGPIVLPFTDSLGHPLKSKIEPIDFGDDTGSGKKLAIDSREPLISPREAYQSLPPFVKSILFAKSP